MKRFATTILIARMASRAYSIYMKGRPDPVIDGFTAEQRRFMGLAQARRGVRDAARAGQVPPEQRVTFW